MYTLIHTLGILQWLLYIDYIYLVVRRVLSFNLQLSGKYKRTIR